MWVVVWSLGLNLNLNLNLIELILDGVRWGGVGLITLISYQLFLLLHGERKILLGCVVLFRKEYCLLFLDFWLDLI